MRRLLFLISVVVFVLLAACVRADRPTAATITAPPTASPTKPGAQGWLLCLSTDRPIYHPGDTVNGRVVILDAVTFAPTAPRLPISLRMHDPHGKTGTSSLVWSADSIAAFSWTLPRQVAEGNYRITADTAAAAPATPAERGVLITTERTPALDLDLRLAREAWAPGETATATLRVRQHDGGAVPGATARASAHVDGQQIDLAALMLDATGEATVQVPLPATFTGGVLSVTIDDGGRIEQLVRPLRRLGQPLIAWTPESGALLADVPNVVYLQAQWRADEPLALRGTLMDDQQQRIAEVVTTHEGRARVSFTPRTDRQYHLTIQDPAGVSATYPLPPASTTGVLLHARDEQIAAGEPARLELVSASARACRIALTRRGALVAETTIMCVPRVAQSIALALPVEISGVLEATVYDSNHVALAQRLLFRVPARRLSITMTNDRPRYGLNENATVTVQVRDEAGQPVAAVVSVAVIDAGTDSAVPPRERAPRLPVMALLENEVDLCADPTVYLNDPRALDLLLGTQQWRQLFDPLKATPSTRPSRELALRRLLMRRQPLWPAWPAMLPLTADAPVPALSSRHHGKPVTPTSPAAALPTMPPSQGVTDEGLRWMRRTQRPDGSWSPTYPTEDVRLDADRTGVAPWSGVDADRATTALMLLCYMGAGYDHVVPNRYKKSVSNGITWLVAQAPDGRFSHDATVQGVVTWCLAEAYAMTNDQALKPVCEQAVAAILADQVQWQGQRLGWSATTADAPICDADASLWCVFALKGALAGGLAIGDGMQGAKAYVQAAWQAANRTETLVKRDRLATFPTRWDPRSGVCHQPHAPAQGLSMAIWLGFHAGHPLAESLAAHTFDRYYPPTLPLPLIESHLASVGLFQMGGERWKKWDEAFRALLFDLQEDDSSPLRGSWDPQLFDAFAAHGGRTISSAFACLSLEFYYRFKDVNASGAADAATAAPPPHEFDAGTRYWNAALRTDPTTGTATLTFPTPARPADLRVVVDAVDARGALGSGDDLLRCGADLTLEARLPQHLRVGDTVQVPLSVRDRRTSPATSALLSLDGVAETPIALTQGVARQLVPLTASGPGILPIAWQVQAGDATDALRHTIAVGNLGFPWDQHLTGMITDHADAAPITFPQDITANSRLARLTVYPSPAARLIGAFAGLVKEPHGCFEQISATSYPLIQAERLISSRPAPDERLRERMRAMLQMSYDQLIAYEVPDGGFSWWGKAPAHAALSAFGLMQFRELADVIPVDATLLERTRTWLLTQRDEHGIFVMEANQQPWGKACTNPYITWALLESAADPQALASELTLALDAVDNDARTSTNAYVVALAANALLRGGRRDAARAALMRLTWNADGSVDGATASLLSANLDDARQQATALALLAWLTLDQAADQPPADQARNTNAGRYLLGRCADGTFGTTQTTVLTLRALRAFDQRLATERQEPVDVILTIDGKDLPTPVKIPAISDEPISVDLSVHLAVGDHRLGVRQSGTRHLPWTLTLSGSTATPPPVGDPGFGLHVALDQLPRYSLGSSVMINVSWKSKQDLPTPVAVIGIPGGLRPVRAALDDLVAAGDLDAWEQTGDLLVLYWDVLYDYTNGLSFPCVAEVPGTFTGPPSRLYPYYDPSRRAWSTPLNVTIAAPPGW